MESSSPSIERQAELTRMAEDAAFNAAPAFRAAGWCWTVKDGKSVEPYVPDVFQIEACIKGRVATLLEADKDCSVSSGRFTVWRETSLGYVSYGVSLDCGSYDEEIKSDAA